MLAYFTVFLQTSFTAAQVLFSVVHRTQTVATFAPCQLTGSEPSPSLWLVEVHRQQADNEHSGEYGYDGCQRGLVEAPGLPTTSGRLGVGVTQAASSDHLSAKHSLREADLNGA